MKIFTCTMHRYSKKFIVRRDFVEKKNNIYVYIMCIYICIYIHMNTAGKNKISGCKNEDKI